MTPLFTDLSINKEKSLLLALQNVDLIEDNKCYGNIFGLLKADVVPPSYRIAFGYYGIPSINMVRHCFFIENKDVIDPTLILIKKRHHQYHVVKTYDVEEYKTTVNSFFNNNPGVELDISFASLLKTEEKNYCEYAITNEIVIDEVTYEKFLKPYDINHQIKVFLH